MDNKRSKDLIDLHDYLDTLEGDRPPLGVFLKELGIDPHTMSDCVMNAARCVSITVPDVSIEIVNTLFKIGVTIGYKYAIKKQMGKEFSMEPEDE